MTDKGFSGFIGKPKKIGKERKERLTTIIKSIPGPKSVLTKIENIGKKLEEDPVPDMMEEEKEMIQYGIETARRLEEEKKKQRDLDLKMQRERREQPPVIKEMENTRTDRIFSEENLTDKEIDFYELGKHFTKHDAWTAINGNVFDITEFVNEHPGGAVILKAAGKDGTSLFRNFSSILIFRTVS